MSFRVGALVRVRSHSRIGVVTRLVKNDRGKIRYCVFFDSYGTTIFDEHELEKLAK